MNARASAESETERLFTFTPPPPLFKVSFAWMTNHLIHLIGAHLCRRCFGCLILRVAGYRPMYPLNFTQIVNLSIIKEDAVILHFPSPRFEQISYTYYLSCATARDWFMFMELWH